VQAEGPIGVVADHDLEERQTLQRSAFVLFPFDPSRLRRLTKSHFLATSNTFLLLSSPIVAPLGFCPVGTMSIDLGRRVLLAASSQFVRISSIDSGISPSESILTPTGVTCRGWRAASVPGYAYSSRRMEEPGRRRRRITLSRPSVFLEGTRRERAVQREPGRGTTAEGRRRTRW
jgi:hypothetical protein